MGSGANWAIVRVNKSTEDKKAFVVRRRSRIVVAWKLLRVHPSSTHTLTSGRQDSHDEVRAFGLDGPFDKVGILLPIHF